MKKLISDIILVFSFVFMASFCIYWGTKIGYTMGYEDMVKHTIRDFVKSECLKQE